MMTEIIRICSRSKTYNYRQVATTAGSPGTAPPPVECGVDHGLWLLFKYSTVGRINHYSLYLFYVVVNL